MKRLFAVFEAAGRSAVIYIAISAGLLGIGMLRASRDLVHAFDTGIYLQVLAWMNSLGDFPGWDRFFSWPSSLTGESNFLAHHFQPVVALLLPVYRAIPSTGALFLVSWLALGATAIALGIRSASLRRAAAGGGDVPSSLVVDAFGPLFVCLFPAFSARLYFGFAPDVIAVPAFVLQAMIVNSLSSRTGGVIIWPPKPSEVWAGGLQAGPVALLLFIVAQTWSGLCKEVFWVINAWVALVLAWRLNWLVQRKAALVILAWCLMQAGFFIWLFFKWMPAHSAHQDYYGLNYIDFRLTGILQANWARILELLFASGFFAALLRPTWSLLLILPGLAIVILGRYSQIQAPTALYPLAFAPFLAVILAENLAVLQGWRQRVTRLLCVAAVAAGVILQGPLLFRSTVPAFSGVAKALPVDLSVVKKNLSPDAYLLVDGNLQPALHEWRKIRVILGFIGNPAPLGPDDFKAATDVLTLFDVDKLESCGAVKPDASDDWAARGVPFHDYGGFQRFCEWLRAVPRQKQIYPDSGLVHYHLN